MMKSELSISCFDSARTGKRLPDNKLRVYAGVLNLSPVRVRGVGISLVETEQHLLLVGTLVRKAIKTAFPDTEFFPDESDADLAFYYEQQGDFIEVFYGADMVVDAASVKDVVKLFFDTVEAEPDRISVMCTVLSRYGWDLKQILPETVLSKVRAISVTPEPKAATVRAFPIALTDALKAALRKGMQSCEACPEKANCKDTCSRNTDLPDCECEKAASDEDEPDMTGPKNKYRH